MITAATFPLSWLEQTNYKGILGQCHWMAALPLTWMSVLTYPTSLSTAHMCYCNWVQRPTLIQAPKQVFPTTTKSIGFSKAPHRWIKNKCLILVEIKTACYRLPKLWQRWHGCRQGYMLVSEHNVWSIEKSLGSKETSLLTQLKFCLRAASTSTNNLMRAVMGQCHWMTALQWTWRSLLTQSILGLWSWGSFKKTCQDSRVTSNILTHKTWVMPKGCLYLYSQV